MRTRTSTTFVLGIATLLAAVLPACNNGGSSGSSGGGGGNAASNRARFSFDCDLNGLVGALTMEIEAINAAGVVFGSGPTPDITGVIGTGGVLYVTSGELVSPTARYVFTGDNQFADFTDLATNARFRVQFVSSPQGVDLIINPFGPGPTQHACTETGAVYL